MLLPWLALWMNACLVGKLAGDKAHLGGYIPQ